MSDTIEFTKQWIARLQSERDEAREARDQYRAERDRARDTAARYEEELARILDAPAFSRNADAFLLRQAERLTSGYPYISCGAPGRHAVARVLIAVADAIRARAAVSGDTRGACKCGATGWVVHCSECRVESTSGDTAGAAECTCYGESPCICGWRDRHDHRLRDTDAQPA